MSATRVDFIDGVTVDCQRLDLSMHVGEDYAVDFVFKDSAGNVEDVTGWQLVSEVRDKKGNLLVTLTDTIIDAVNGHIRLSADDVTTKALAGSEGIHVFDIFRIDAGGDKKKRIYGDFQISKSETDV